MDIPIDQASRLIAAARGAGRRVRLPAALRPTRAADAYAIQDAIGAVLERGTGCHALGNPLPLLPWLANHARNNGGIGAGTAVTTGAWLGLHRVEPGSTVTVEFVGIGSAEVAFPR